MKLVWKRADEASKLGLLTKDSLIVRGRFLSQHPNMERDYVLVAVTSTPEGMTGRVMISNAPVEVER